MYYAIKEWRTFLMETSQIILKLIAEKGRASPSEIIDFTGFSPRTVFWQLSKLYEQKKIDRVGRVPRVYYFIRRIEENVSNYNLSANEQGRIDGAYFAITPMGEQKHGLEAFAYWCGKQNLPVDKTAKEYVNTMNKYEKYRERSGLIDATYKVRDTFEKAFIDKLYYVDFYSIERFGKTKLGWMLLYAKQSQSKELIKEVVALVKDKIEKVVKRHNIDAVAFVPPTLKRSVQFMFELEKTLNMSMPRVDVVKVKTPIIVPQKSLTRLDERVENARNSIVVAERRRFKNVLIIDDAVGSGATMNETARMLRDAGICSGKLIGLAITGSFKGFDVISEV